MEKFVNQYLAAALDTLQSRRGVIEFTEQEEKLYQVLTNRDEKSVLAFLRENSNFNFLIISLQR